MLIGLSNVFTDKYCMPMAMRRTVLESLTIAVNTGGRNA